MLVTMITNTSRAQQQTSSGSAFNSIEVNGMTFRWAFDGELLHCEATAPTSGWVAIGFNTRDQLSGTNLIMGAVEHDFVTIDDRYIIKPGLHKSISAWEALRHSYSDLAKKKMVTLPFHSPFRFPLMTNFITTYMSGKSIMS